MAMGFRMVWTRIRLDPSDGLRPTTLTFDLAGMANAQRINQDYGDGVTNNVMGGFAYGGDDPLHTLISG